MLTVRQRDYYAPLLQMLFADICSEMCFIEGKRTAVVFLFPFRRESSSGNNKLVN